MGPTSLNRSAQGVIFGDRTELKVKSPGCRRGEGDTMGDGQRVVGDESIVHGGSGTQVNTVQSTPSVCERVKRANVKSSGRTVMTSSANQSCVVGRDKLCEIHRCAIKKIKVKSSKWRWIEKKKSFGFVNVQTMRVICGSKGDIPVEPEHSTPIRNLARDLGSAREGISKLERVNQKSFESESLGQNVVI